MASGLAVADTPTPDLIRLMTGRNVEYVFPPRRELSRRTPPSCSTSTGSHCGARSPTSRSTVRAGEVVGLAGLVGSGRSEILETMYGARRATAGTVSVDGKRLRPGSVRHARSTRASASRPRSARARACCSRSPSSRT